jgi:serine/threonine protein kinase
MAASETAPLEMSLDDCVAAMERIPDDELFPELPADQPITLAPRRLNMNKGAAFVKRAGLSLYHPDPKDKNGPGCEAKDLLREEVLIMERLSARPHPYIVRYLGCRVHRGRITAIVTQALKWNLNDYAYDMPAKFLRLDKECFLAGVESAVRYMQSLGLAHNDVNSNNIMVREEDETGSCTPALIDFGSSGPFGGRLLNAGSLGFANMEDPELFVSLKRHDEWSFDRMREWWDDAVRDAEKAVAQGES